MPTKRSTPGKNSTALARVEGLARRDDPKPGNDLERHSGDSIARYDPSVGGHVKNCPARIIDIVTEGTRDGKIVWFRDARWFAVTFVPFLAVSFRLKYVQPATTKDGPMPNRVADLTIAFMDGKPVPLLASAYPNVQELGRAVAEQFGDDHHRRERNERLEWLEAALNKFLPMVVTGDPRD